MKYFKKRLLLLLENFSVRNFKKKIIIVNFIELLNVLHMFWFSSLIDEVYHLFFSRSENEIWEARPRNTFFKFIFLLLATFSIFLLAEIFLLH